MKHLTAETVKLAHLIDVVKSEDPPNVVAIILTGKGFGRVACLVPPGSAREIAQKLRACADEIEQLH